VIFLKHDFVMIFSPSFKQSASQMNNQPNINRLGILRHIAQCSGHQEELSYCNP
jgi:hypothetical protein